MKAQFEIWLANLNPSKGTEPGKIRPIVIIQSDLLNKVGHPSTLACPITSQLSPKENLLRVKLDTVGTGLEQDSEVLIDQIRALDNQRLLQRLGKISPNQSAELLWKLKAILDL
jgi:mRNA interferase MazF